MKTVIIKYNAGNIQSVSFALERIGVNAIVTDDPDEILSADKVIFPGVGEAGSAMRYLKDKHLDRLIADLQQPVLGICLGMQLLCSHTEEADTPCLNIFKNVKVKKFRAGNTGVKIPQIGWNTITGLRSALFNKVSENTYCYFVHGFYAEENINTIAGTHYIQSYSSALQQENFYGVQFHPEKSAAAGEQILKNFIAL